MVATSAIALGLITVGPLAAQQNDPRPPTFWTFSTLLDTPGLVRYNRVEGASLGASLDFASRGWMGEGTVRVGWADRRPNAALQMSRRVAGGTFRLRGEAGLRGTQPFERPLGIENTLGSVLFGRDLGEYMRVEGLRVGFVADDKSWSLLLKGERQKPVTMNRAWSLVEVDRATGGAPFGIERPLAPTEPVTTLGAEASLYHRWGSDPSRPRYYIRAQAMAEGGTKAFTGFAIRASSVQPIGAGGPRRARPPFTFTIRPEVGVVSDSAPAQRRRSLGGAWTIRGWNPASLSGTRWFAGRAQLDWHTTVGDLGVFFDMATVSRPKSASESVAIRTHARSVGIGVGLLDGVIRIDLAAPLEAGRGMRLEAWLVSGLP